jgi:hypothetical protein
VDKSLVVADHLPQSVRYRLLETVRQYSAQELLRSAGEDGVLEVRELHAGYYLELARTAAPHTTGHGQAGWLRRLDAEWDNLRAAFAQLSAAGRADDVCRLAGYLRRFSLSRGHSAVLDYVRPVIDRPGATPSAALAEALAVAGQLLGLLARADPGELSVARAYGERALAMARAVGDLRAEAHALSKLGESAYVENDLAAVEQFAIRGAAIARQLDDQSLLAEHLQGLAASCPDGPQRRAIRLESLACARQAGDEMLAASELNHLFGMDLRAGRLEDAAAWLEEATVLVAQFGGEIFEHFLGMSLALLRVLQGRFAEAAPLVRVRLLANRRLGQGIGSCTDLLFAAACCATWQGSAEKAARLHGATGTAIESGLAAGMITWTDAEQELRGRDQELLRQQLGVAEFDRCYRSGQALTAPAAIELALSGPDTA